MGKEMFDALRPLYRSRNDTGFLLVTALLVLAVILGPRSADADGWVVVFEDEFGQPSLDTSKWYTRYIYNSGTMDHFNNELQRYRDSNNHVLQAGVLNLIARGPTSTRLYTSGMIR